MQYTVISLTLNTPAALPQCSDVGLHRRLARKLITSQIPVQLDMGNHVTVM